MSDEKLRELERRFKETGSVEDEAAWLIERVRVGESLDWENYSRLSELNVEAAAEYLRGRVELGELTQERLELASYCGHEAARKCSGTEGHEEQFEDWVQQLAFDQRALLLRSTPAVLRASLPSFREAPVGPTMANALEDIDMFFSSGKRELLETQSCQRVARWIGTGLPQLLLSIEDDEASAVAALRAAAKTLDQEVVRAVLSEQLVRQALGRSLAT